MSHRIPHGWMADPRNPAKLVENPPEQAVIARIVEMRIQGGMSYREIGRKLAEKGLSCRGGAWYHSTVANIFSRAKAG